MFELKNFNISKFDSILARGLCTGVGTQGEQVCIEAAICEALGLPHGDDPGCVAEAVRSFKITLNDSRWSSDEARAKGLRSLGIAQLGSKGVVNDVEFSKRISEKTIRVLIPKLFRQIFTNQECLDAADKCESEGTANAAYAAARYADADAARYAYAAAARYAAAADAARYAAADAAKKGDEYLLLVADLALDVLRELKSPGVELL